MGKGKNVGQPPAAVCVAVHFKINLWQPYLFFYQKDLFVCSFTGIFSGLLALTFRRESRLI